MGVFKRVVLSGISALVLSINSFAESPDSTPKCEWIRIKPTRAEATNYKDNPSLWLVYNKKLDSGGELAWGLRAWNIDYKIAQEYAKRIHEEVMEKDKEMMVLADYQDKHEIYGWMVKKGDFYEHRECELVKVKEVK